MCYCGRVVKTYGFDLPQFKGSWLIMLKQIGMMFGLSLAHQETLHGHYTTEKECVFSIGFNLWKSTPTKQT
jgi:hypothetical protein